MIKVCNKCNIEKDLGFFSKNREGKYGYKSYCKNCQYTAGKEYHQKNKQDINHKHRKRYQENKQHVLGRTAKYAKEKRKIDINFRLMHCLRSRLQKALKGNFKSGSAVRDLGCSIEDLKKWLEQQFYFNPKTNEPMTWQNYGELWHIDHIIPLSKVNLQNSKELRKVCHWFNLQPLWAVENIIKSNKLEIL